MGNKYIEDIISEETINDWRYDELVIINSRTSSHKSTFVFTKLYEHASRGGRKYFS